jgi:hypothetical protein
MDLAGSEPTRSGQNGATVAEEGTWINLSMLNFGNFARKRLENAQKKNSVDFFYRSSNIAYAYKEILSTSEFCWLFTITAEAKKLQQTQATLEKMITFKSV